MKMTIIRKFVLVSAVVSSLCVVAHARNFPWNPQEKPPVSLAQALSIAQAAFGQDANRLWCVNADIGNSFSDGDWTFTYSNKKGEITHVYVASDRKVRIRRPGDMPYPKT